MDENYHFLIRGIILRAVLDYHVDLTKYYMGKYTIYTVARIKQVENFFRSDWFYLMSDYDGEQIINLIKAKAQKGEALNIPKEII